MHRGSKLIVVDLGCHDRGNWPSLQTLVEEYRPDLIYGFDPDPDTDTSVTEIGGVRAEITRSAAWLHNGTVGFVRAENSSRVDPEGVLVDCFDFSAWLRDVGPCVVKMDIEGAEYPLLKRLVDDGTDELIVELLLEWHGYPDEDVLALLACPVKEWTM